MKENYFNRMVEEFGVKMGEAFDLKHKSYTGRTVYNPYRFTECGLVDAGGRTSPAELQDLLMGDLVIVKLSWAPFYGGKYYYVSATGEIVGDYFFNRTLDILNAYIGNCFETEEAAKIKKNEITDGLKESFSIGGVEEGSYVSVANSEEQYRNYDKFVRETCKEYYNNFDKGRTISGEMRNLYEVIKIKKHLDYDRLLCVIENVDTKNIFVVGIEGLARVSPVLK